MMKRTCGAATLLTLSTLLWPLLTQAQPTASQTASAQQSSATATRGLSPEQVATIRKVGRNILAAKKSGQEDAADAGELASLRSSVEDLIAADLNPKNQPAITVQGHERSEQRISREHHSNLRNSARANARALAAQLRSRSELIAAQAHGAPEADTHSAGLPIGKQRARLFERLAGKLDATLAENNQDRASQLRELRDQLRVTKGSLVETSATHGTPTLQAMPAGYVPPKNNDAAKD